MYRVLPIVEIIKVKTNKIFTKHFISLFSLYLIFLRLYFPQALKFSCHLKVRSRKYMIVTEFCGRQLVVY